MKRRKQVDNPRGNSYVEPFSRGFGCNSRLFLHFADGKFLTDATGKNGEESFKIRDAPDAGGQHIFLDVGPQKTFEKDIPLIGIVSRDSQPGILPNDLPKFLWIQGIKTTSRSKSASATVWRNSSFCDSVGQIF